VSLALLNCSEKCADTEVNECLRYSLEDIRIISMSILAANPQQSYIDFETPIHDTLPPEKKQDISGKESKNKKWTSEELGSLMFCLWQLHERKVVPEAQQEPCVKKGKISFYTMLHDMFNLFEKSGME